MKILMLSNFGLGLYKFRSELIQKLISHGHELHVAFPKDNYEGKIKDLGCFFWNTPIDRRGMNPLKDIKLLYSYKTIIKKVQPNLVMTFTVKPNIYGGLITRLYKIPTISTITGLGTSLNKSIILKFMITFLYKISLKKSFCVFFQNETNKEFFAQSILTNQRMILVPGSGVNIKEFSYSDYPIDDKIIRFIYIGRIMKEKGIVELIEAFRILHREYENLQLDIIGFCEDGLDNLINESVKEGIINYYGQQDNIIPYIEKSHALVLPSHHEGLSNVLLEACSIGRPVLASNIPGCIEVFDDGISGFAFAVNDVKSLIDALRLFITLDYEKKRTMGLEARKKISNHFDRNLVIEKYIEQIKVIEENKYESL